MSLNVVNRVIFSTAVAVMICFDLSAQELQSDKREFLKSITPEKTDLIRRDNTLSVSTHEYFAKPNRFGLFEFDIEALRREGEIITITPPGGEPIEILSHGIQVRQPYGHTARWTGEIALSGSKRAYPVKWALGVRAITEDGKVVDPDPNWEITRKQLSQGNATVLEESYNRRNETIVFEILRSTIIDPETNATIVLSKIGEDLTRESDFDVIAVYELDDSKAVWVGDVLDQEGESERQLSSEEQFLREEVKRRAQALGTHIDKVKQSIQNNGVKEQ